LRRSEEIFRFSEVFGGIAQLEMPREFPSFPVENMDMTHKFLIAVALILIWSSIAGAQEFTIHGNVTAPSKKPIGSYDVSLNYKNTDQIAAHSVVGNSGEFNFYKVPEGDYEVVINLEGFRESKTVVRVSSVTGVTGPFQSVSIILVPDSRSRRDASERAAYTESISNEYEKGLVELDSHHPELAVTHLENVVYQLPDFSDSHLHLGFAYQQLSRRDLAEKEFRKAQEQKPNSARPLVALGRLYLEEVDTQIHSGAKPEAYLIKVSLAREVLAKAIAIDERFATAYYYMGAVDYRSSEYMGAEEHLVHALELDPHLTAARILLYNVNIQQEQWPAAFENLEKSLLENLTSDLRKELEQARASVLKRL